MSASGAFGFGGVGRGGLDRFDGRGVDGRLGFDGSYGRDGFRDGRRGGGCCGGDRSCSYPICKERCDSCSESGPKVVTKCCSVVVAKKERRCCKPGPCDRVFHLCSRGRTCCLPPVFDSDVGPAQQINLLLSNNSATGYANGSFEVVPHPYTCQATVRYCIQWDKLGTYTPSFKCTDTQAGSCGPNIVKGKPLDISIGAIRLRGPYRRNADTCDPFDCQAPVIANLSVPRVIPSGYGYAIGGSASPSARLIKSPQEAVLLKQYHNVHEVNSDDCHVSGTIELADHYACMLLKGEVIMELIPIFYTVFPTTFNTSGIIPSWNDFPVFNEGFVCVPTVAPGADLPPTVYCSPCAEVVGELLAECPPAQSTCCTVPRVYNPIRGRIICKKFNGCRDGRDGRGGHDGRHGRHAHGGVRGGPGFY